MQTGSVPCSLKVFHEPPPASHPPGAYIWKSLPFYCQPWETERDRLTFSPTLINLSYTTLHIHLVNKAHKIIIDDTITNLHTCLHIKKQEREGEITLSKAPIGAVSYLFLWSLPSRPLLLTVLWVWDVRTFCLPLCVLFLHLDRNAV